MDLPYLTKDLPGIGGVIKQAIEDFCVDEVPLYEFAGKGSHAYFRVHKAGVPTPVAVHRIAKHLGVHPGDIGFAGLKDAQAVTSQWMSLEHADAGRLKSFRDANVRIGDVTWHNNKLRVGHLAGNRFVIRIRGVSAVHMASARAVLDVLVRRGVPNFFGPQRFGSRGDTGRLGAALVRGDLDEFVKLLLGRAMPSDPPDCRAARDAFDVGYFDRAMQRWPRHYTDQRHALIAYKRRKNPGAAIAAVDKRMKRLYVSAFQSEIFNVVLSRRLATFDHLINGDIVQFDRSNACFFVEDALLEQARADRFELSPTGPIVGYRCNFAEGAPGEIEQKALTQFHIGVDDFRRVGTLQVKGSRRPLRFALQEPNLTTGRDQQGQFIELAFMAPSGCYATVALREIMKTETADEDADAPQDD